MSTATNTNNNTNNSNQRNQRDIIVWILFICTLIATISGVLGSIDKISKNIQTFFHINQAQFDTFFVSSMEIFNLIILTIFFLIIKATKLEFLPNHNTAAIIAQLRITDTATKKKEDAFSFNTTRVNKLVRQIEKNISIFIVFLFFFYLVLLFEDTKVFGTIPQLQNTALPFVENIFNFLSALFIYFAFQVLYDKTLDDGNDSLPYWRGSSVFFVIYITLYSIALFSDNKEVANIFRFICGIYNGFAMGLLFGRVTSMEYLFKNVELTGIIAQRQDRRLYHICTIYILPLYVIAQPLYGVFNLSGVTDIIIFKSIVFLICALGKFAFLFLFYEYVTHRWFHVYLHVSLANHGIPHNLIDLFLTDHGNAPAVVPLPDSTNPVVSVASGS